MRERSRPSATRSAEVDRKTHLAVRGISANLRRLLKGVDLKDLAEALDLSEDRVQDLLQGNVPDIGVDKLTIIARKYDLRLDEFFSGLEGL